MNVNLPQGLLSTAQYLPSQHFNERPGNGMVDMIVVHGISLPPGQFGTGAIAEFFCGKLDMKADPYYASIATLRVSSHLLIMRTGEIIQFVPFSQRAWHAGQSSFQGRENCNDFSIGIELEGTDEVPYEPIQYQKLAQVIRALQAAYPAITRERIVGHSDIAPGRKTDPGPHFKWHDLDCLLMA